MIHRCILLAFFAVVLWPFTAVLAASTEKELLLQKRMSTKTIYPLEQALAAHEAADEVASGDGTCHPIQLNFVIRHGTRYPTIKDITRINATHRKLLNATEAPWINTWTNPYEAQQAGWLADAGVDELMDMGRRMRERFGLAFEQQFHKQKFVFEHTWKVRTEQSAMAFAFGFFGGHQLVHYEAEDQGQDHELRFFDNCPVFNQRIEHNKSATIEHALYRTSSQMQRNLKRFRQLARLTKDVDLDQKDMEAAYAGCAFDMATQGQEMAHWCSLFDAEMLRSMDYFHDLKHFYKKGHGHPLAFQIASPLLQDIFQSMQARVEQASDVEGHFRFAHAETILPLASLLNLSFFDRHVNDRDGHFRADTPLFVAEQRRFKGAELSPFMANIGFVLHECTSSHETSHAVQLLLNEQTIRLDECDHRPLCPLNQLEAIFHRWIHEYDFVTECGSMKVTHEASRWKEK